MSDNEENKTSEGPRQFCAKRFIQRLEAEGFVQWDAVTWIRPEDIPVFVAKAKINRARRRRALVMEKRAETKAKREPSAA